MRVSLSPKMKAAALAGGRGIRQVPAREMLIKVLRQAPFDKLRTNGK